ncbi:MAG: hypothetical protein ACK587_06000 [Cyanobacteriota bacterium]
MTSLIAWAGIDSRGPSSIYIASDSRISWDGSGAIKWDQGRKVFAASQTPEIFGFCGDVLFPSIFLSQLTGILVDNGVRPITNAKGRAEAILEYTKSGHDGFPLHGGGDSFTIHYCCREGENMKGTFHVYVITYSHASYTWSMEKREIPKKSGLVFVGGSGETALKTWQDRWQSTSQGGTSRAIFSAFCDSLDSNHDPKTGGAPQLVGIKRSFRASHYGILWKDNRYELGFKLPPDRLAHPKSVEWMNSLFERCDPSAMKPLPSAKRHHKPSGLGNELGITGVVKVPK